jgi:hypothetical protein
MGATACVVVPSFWHAHQEPDDWQILARWIDENLPYSSLQFFPKYWAVNINWHERPQRLIGSFAERKSSPHRCRPRHYRALTP